MMLTEDQNGHAIPEYDLLHDFFVEHAPDEIESDPSTWPDWTDGHSWELGPEQPQTVTTIDEEDRAEWIARRNYEIEHHINARFA